MAGRHTCRGTGGHPCDDRAGYIARGSAPHAPRRASRRSSPTRPGPSELGCHDGPVEVRADGRVVTGRGRPPGAGAGPGRSEHPGRSADLLGDRSGYPTAGSSQVQSGTCSRRATATRAPEADTDREPVTA
jgi:hypothetical protein